MLRVTAFCETAAKKVRRKSRCHSVIPLTNRPDALAVSNGQSRDAWKLLRFESPRSICNTCCTEASAIPDLDWLLFLPQLPASPSSARVALWRRLRASGAAGLLNGVWALPNTQVHAELLAQLAETVRAHGGSAILLAGCATGPSEREAVLVRFQADRAREYKEFSERAQRFLAEVQRETQLQKFTFAELEELEDDRDKLAVWLAKILARDFYPNDSARLGAEILQRCGESLHAFTDAVYAREGVAPAAGEISPNPDDKHALERRGRSR